MVELFIEKLLKYSVKTTFFIINMCVNNFYKIFLCGLFRKLATTNTSFYVIAYNESKL